MTTNRCDYFEHPAWEALKRAWERYRAMPTEENRSEYYEAAVSIALAGEGLWRQGQMRVETLS